jgi:hypothetical protein
MALRLRTTALTLCFRTFGRGLDDALITALLLFNRSSDSVFDDFSESFYDDFLRQMDRAWLGPHARGRSEVIFILNGNSNKRVIVTAALLSILLAAFSKCTGIDGGIKGEGRDLCIFSIVVSFRRGGGVHKMRALPAYRKEVFN